MKSDNVEVITSKYNRNTCGFISTIIITNFTTANEGIYTCNASQPYSNYSSDNVYIFIDNVTSTGKFICVKVKALPQVVYGEYLD